MLTFYGRKTKYCLFPFQVETHLKMNNVPSVIIRCYGITKDPETNDFMMVMDYAENGS